MMRYFREIFSQKCKFHPNVGANEIVAYNVYDDGGCIGYMSLLSNSSSHLEKHWPHSSMLSFQHINIVLTVHVNSWKI